MSRPVTHALIYLKTPLPRPPRNIISGRIKWEALGNKSRETGGQVRLTCMREGPRSKQDSEAGADGGGGGNPTTSHFSTQGPRIRKQPANLHFMWEERSQGDYEGNRNRAESVVYK